MISINKFVSFILRVLTFICILYFVTKAFSTFKMRDTTLLVGCALTIFIPLFYSKKNLAIKQVKIALPLCNLVLIAIIMVSASGQIINQRNKLYFLGGLLALAIYATLDMYNLKLFKPLKLNN